jgi:hypothetical protein
LLEKWESEQVEPDVAAGDRSRLSNVASMLEEQPQFPLLAGCETNVARKVRRTTDQQP